MSPDFSWHETCSLLMRLRCEKRIVDPVRDLMLWSVPHRVPGILVLGHRSDGSTERQNSPRYLFARMIE